MTVQPLHDKNITAIQIRALDHFAENMVEPNGRPKADPDRGDLDLDEVKIDPEDREKLTFSETVTYAAFRFAWRGRPKDEAIFARIVDWAENNLQRDKLKHVWTRRTAVLKREFSRFGAKKDLIWSVLVYAGYIKANGQIEKNFTRNRGEFKLAGLFTPKEKRKIFNILYKAKKCWVRIPVPEQFRDALLAWRYIPTLNGPGTPGGVIYYPESEKDRSGINAASDDVEFAAALYIAHLRGWGNGKYLAKAKAILKVAWKKYVVKVGDKYYFAAGDHFKKSGELNPSYFRPAYFSKLFPKIDPEHPWHKLSQTSFDTTVLSGYPGKKLAKNWVAVNHEGDNDDSQSFPGVAGTVFGWDAARVPWAWAQSYLWLGDNNSALYLKDCTVGPLCFLRDRFIKPGRRPIGLNNDGSNVKYKKSVVQTHRTTSLPLSLTMYGSFLPYFHYAGDTESRDAILKKLTGKNSYWNTKGYWGNDPKDYYAQNWVAFGLMLLNDGFPVGLENAIKKLPVPADISKDQIKTDRRVGEVGAVSGTSLRERLNRRKVEELLGLKQMRNTLLALTEDPAIPLLDIRTRMFTNFPQLRSVAEVDFRSDIELLGYFADFNECFNNAIILLSVYKQKLIETNRKHDFEEAVEFCRVLREQTYLQGQAFVERLDFIKFDDMNHIWGALIKAGHVDKAGMVLPKLTPRFSDFYLKGFNYTKQKGIYEILVKAQRRRAAYKNFAPHDYSQSILDLTEVELRAQTIKKDAAFYKAGIDLAFASIETQLNVDRAKAAPDYSIITKNLLAIGNLYRRMYEAEKRKPIPVAHNHLAQSYLKKASQFYNYVVQIQAGVEISIPEEGLQLTISPDIIRSALEFNLKQRHLTKENMESNMRDIRYLKGVAMISDISLYTSIKGEKGIVTILRKIRRTDRAINQLFANTSATTTYFIAYAESVKADLLLALADRIKFYLWPESNSNLSVTSALLTELEDEFGIKPKNKDPNPGSIIKRISVFNKLLIEQSREIYRRIPSCYERLYAVAKINLTQIALRTAEFLDRGFIYLIPFFNDPVFTRAEPIIPDDESLGVSKNYYIGMLLSSSKREKDHASSLIYFGLVTSDSIALAHPYSLYFTLHARLKIAVILAKSKNSKGKARKLFAQVERTINSMSKQDLALMSWRPYSLLAELYQEWANMGGIGSRARNIKALEMCFRSDSDYDFKTRRDDLLMSFDWLDRYDKKFKAKYKRGN